MDKLPIQHLNAELAHLRGGEKPADPVKLLPFLYYRLFHELRGIRDRIGTKTVGEDAGGLPPDIMARFAKCRGIIQFLMETVDPDAGEISRRLSRINSRVHRRTRAAETEKDGRIIDEILPSLETIYDGWVGE
jgi:flagellin-specific chaperone FliS